MHAIGTFVGALVICSIQLQGLAERSLDELIIDAAATSAQLQFFQNNSDPMIELDMEITKEQYADIQSKKRNTLRDTTKRWPGKTVPYQIDDTFTQDDISIVNEAFKDFHTYTCLIFKKATDELNRVSIQDGLGCSSYVGMNGGTQKLNLHPNCRHKRIVLHELGHAIGFFHEQNRPDRDNYVTVYIENVPESVRPNFNKKSSETIDSQNVPYDYYSIMHYGRRAFSFNTEDTIVTKDTSFLDIIGKAKGFSFRDIKLINLMYNCADHCGTKTCPGEGFVGKDCKCYCPGDPIKICSDSESGGGGGGEVSCTNNDNSCDYWASLGYCESWNIYEAWMSNNCKVSCNKCNDDKSDEVVVGSCIDESQHCSYWESVGECTYSPTYMLVNCKKSCGNCGQCIDESEHCSYWQSVGECETNPWYMLVHCKKACNNCERRKRRSLDRRQQPPAPCIDTTTKCKEWAKNGECQNDPLYMLSYCRKSCHHCGNGELDENVSDGTCTDDEPQCIEWAEQGKCNDNRAYMMRSCKKSCGACAAAGAKICEDLDKDCPTEARLDYCSIYSEYMAINCKRTCGLCPD